MTQMQITSIEAYFTKVKPTVGPKQQKVLEAIEELGPCTDSMIVEFLNWPINCVTPRRNELVKKGKVKKAFIGESQNGRSAVWWDIKTRDWQKQYDSENS